MKPKRTHHKNQKWYLTVAAVFLVILFLSTIFFMIRFFLSGKDNTAELVGVLVNSLVAALGFFAIYASIQNDKEVKCFEYIEDYNFSFLTNKEFISVERKLETCNQKYNSISIRSKGVWGTDQKKEFREFCDSVFHTREFVYSDIQGDENTRIDEQGLISEQYQEIVNYLVYLESFVPLLNHNQLGFDDVDDLFGYRFFIAVNNPVLQRNELCRERLYYLGILEVFDKWKKYRDDKMPMANYDLSKEWENYKSLHPKAEE